MQINFIFHFDPQNICVSLYGSVTRTIFRSILAISIINTQWMLKQEMSKLSY